jgi:hypothetical protein
MRNEMKGFAFVLELGKHVDQRTGNKLKSQCHAFSKKTLMSRKARIVLRWTPAEVAVVCVVMPFHVSSSFVIMTLDCYTAFLSN